LAALRDQVATVRMEPPVRRYVVAIANASRVHPELAVGVSPRAVEQMGDAARANALLDSRAYVLPDDVKTLVDPCSATASCPRPTRGSATAPPRRSCAR
jgi:MoxR-like ATPase